MNEKIGEIKINNDIIAVIVGKVAAEVKGVAGMSGGVVDGFAKMLGKTNPEKGVKVDMEEDNDINVMVSIIVDYGVCIPDVCSKIQVNVKEKVEKMTGKNVKAVGINVQGIHFPADETGVEK